MSSENQQVSNAKGAKGSVPLSQDETKITTATEAECIAEMQRIASANPDKFLSRNFFRVHSRLAESAWTRWFGTFQEFKKGANITPSRHVQNHEKHIAKHASTAAYRALNAERRDWAERFQAPAGDRFQTHVVATDIHDHECDPFFRRVLVDVCRRAAPSRLILGGDTFDLAEFGKYSVDPRSWDVVGRIRWVHGFLAELRQVIPNARLDMLEGNHEYRLLRHLAEASPAMQAVLADLHGFTVPRLLGLSEFEVNYHARGDLAAFYQKDIQTEVRKNYLIVDGTYIVHHFPEGMRMGLPGMHGHHHKHIVWPHYSPDRGSFEWHQLGCGHKRQASYCAGERWANGFALVHLDTERHHCAIEYVDLSFGHACVAGKWYFRSADELIE